MLSRVKPAIKAFREMKRTDLAYIAGIVDGEGSIYPDFHLSKKGVTRCNIAVSVNMTDKSALELVKALFGGKIRCQPRAKHKDWKPEFIWKVSGEKAQIILKAIKPYLLTKRAQAEVALRLLEIHQRYKRYSPMERFLQEADAKALKVLNKRGLTRTKK